MSKDERIVGLFTMPQEFPCGEGSTCCGPIGQSEGEIAALKAALEELDVEVELHSIKEPDVHQKYPNVSRLLRTLGKGAVPILTVGEQVVCTGARSVEEAVKAVGEKLISA